MRDYIGLIIIFIVCALGCAATSTLTPDEIVGLCVLVTVGLLGLMALLLAGATAYGLARELTALARLVLRTTRKTTSL